MCRTHKKRTTCDWIHNVLLCALLQLSFLHLPHHPSYPIPSHPLHSLPTRLYYSPLNITHPQCSPPPPSSSSGPSPSSSSVTSSSSTATTTAPPTPSPFSSAQPTISAPTCSVNGNRLCVEEWGTRRCLRPFVRRYLPHLPHHLCPPPTKTPYTAVCSTLHPGSPHPNRYRSPPHPLRTNSNNPNGTFGCGCNFVGLRGCGLLRRGECRGKDRPTRMGMLRWCCGRGMGCLCRFCGGIGWWRGEVRKVGKVGKARKIAKIAKITGRTMGSKSAGPNGGIRKGCCVRCERKRIMTHQTTRSFPNTAPPPTTQNRLSSPSSIVSIVAPSLPSDPPPKSNTPLAYHNRSVACAKWVGSSLCHRVRVGSSTRQHRYA